MVGGGVVGGGVVGDGVVGDGVVGGGVVGAVVGCTDGDKVVGYAVGDEVDNTTWRLSPATPPKSHAWPAYEWSA